MAKMTLLDMVQDILSDMDSDQVNSISDTVESLQVAQIIKSTYYNIVDGRDYPFLHELFQLDSSASVSRPTHMKLPETIIDLDWVKYNRKKASDTRNKYEKVKYLAPEEFLDLVNQRDSSNTTVQIVVDPTSIQLNILNNKAPEYFTSFDNETIVFDSFDSGLESTIQNSKLQCYGRRSVVFTLSDTFIPDLPVQMFSYLLSESKSVSFITLKQVPNQKAEQASISQKRRLSQDTWEIRNGIYYPNYGRK
jgi:hypothetical protein